MTRPAAASAPAPTSGLLPAIGVFGLACLAVITFASPGATRMFAWPWSLGYAGALLAPVLVLLLHAFAAQRRLVLPSRPWCFGALASACAVLVSALASPYRGSSLLWSAPFLAAVAVFFVVHHARHHDLVRPARLDLLVGLFFAATMLVSLALWLPTLPGRSLQLIAAARNPFPLGHTNYTAGLALLALPWFGVLAARARGLPRASWSSALVVTLVLLISSGSRAAVPALAALGLVALLVAPLPRRKKIVLLLALPLVAFAFAVAHPRTRAMFAPADPAAAPNLSNVQRSAMLTSAARMGQDRPWFGWGPGTTPLAYPRYRFGLDGGAENVLQLHCTPAQLWAEFGAAGLACALAFTTLALRAFVRSPTPSPAALALVGYAVFSLADWQLDVPVFAFAVALCLAHLAPPAPSSSLSPRLIGFFTLGALAVVVLLGRPDPTPALNIRALALARTSTPATTAEAIALLRESLALNPDQEIAHFNLGWLLLIADPAAAERAFDDALHLVPDKGGVYFGLGLARLNQNRPAAAARAFALECLNDPAFLSSPWWREPAVAAVLPNTRAEFAHLASLAATALEKRPHSAWAAAQLPRVAALAPRLGALPAGPERSYRRERTAYPVLVRNLDLPPPLDLYDVREFLSPSLSASPLPLKSWLPNSLLLELLDAPTAPPMRH
ncbi:MAG: O-antigen ligase family protein [Opitutaceae bacterium]